MVPDHPLYVRDTAWVVFLFFKMTPEKSAKASGFTQEAPQATLTPLSCSPNTPPPPRVLNISTNAR